MSLTIVGLVPSVIVGYALTVAVETPVLFLSLQKKYSAREKLLAGLGLTAFSYPFVCFVFPALMPIASIQFVVVAEIFAPLSEVVLFWFWLGGRQSLRNVSTWRDAGAIVLANVASFAFGEWLKWARLIQFVS